MQPVSTHIEGAIPPLVRVHATASLGAGEVSLAVSVKELGDNFWSYNVGEPGRNNRVGFGRVSATDHITALRQASGIVAAGYPSGTIERGLLEQFAKGDAP
jgi:hypothetical protein